MTKVTCFKMAGLWRVLMQAGVLAGLEPRLWRAIVEAAAVLQSARCNLQPARRKGGGERGDGAENDGRVGKGATGHLTEPEQRDGHGGGLAVGIAPWRANGYGSGAIAAVYRPGWGKRGWEMQGGGGAGEGLERSDGTAPGPCRPRPAPPSRRPRQ